MITIFNRKELFITNSIERYKNAAGDLKAANIPYTSKVSGAGSRGRAMRGKTGTPVANSNLYVIYVREKDYNRALSAISKDE